MNGRGVSVVDGTSVCVGEDVLVAVWDGVGDGLKVLVTVGACRVGVRLGIAVGVAVGSAGIAVEKLVGFAVGASWLDCSLIVQKMPALSRRIARPINANRRFPRGLDGRRALVERRLEGVDPRPLEMGWRAL